MEPPLVYNPPKFHTTSQLMPARSQPPTRGDLSHAVSPPRLRYGEFPRADARVVVDSATGATTPDRASAAGSGLGLVMTGHGGCERVVPALPGR